MLCATHHDESQVKLMLSGEERQRKIKMKLCFADGGTIKVVTTHDQISIALHRGFV